MDLEVEIKYEGNIPTVECPHCGAKSHGWELEEAARTGRLGHNSKKALFKVSLKLKLMKVASFIGIIQ
jgi:hypothetical protein